MSLSGHLFKNLNLLHDVLHINRPDSVLLQRDALHRFYLIFQKTRGFVFSWASSSKLAINFLTLLPAGQKSQEQTVA